MVNFIGRLFVLLTFSGSLVLLALAISVYSSHVDWKSANKDRPGTLDKLEGKIKELAYARDRSVERYNGAYNELGQVEGVRAFRQRYYEFKYAMLKTGKDEKGQVQATPVYQLEFDKASGLVQVRMVPAANLAIQARNEPLRSQEAFQAALSARSREINAEQDRIKTLQVDLANLTSEMQGSANAPGLIKRKEIMADARLRAMSEQEFLKPALANRFAEATLALEREQDLRKRLEQLNRSGGRASGD